jgi:NAD(P)H-dependent FMN reductase
MAKIAVIVGSVRSERQGIKVANWIVKKLEERNHKVSLVDPLELQLPLLDKMYKEMKTPSEDLQKLYAIIKEADGYISVTPEYNHSTSFAMKNTLDYFLEEYFFKPSGIVSYFTGSFGGYLQGIISVRYLLKWGLLQFHLKYQYQKSKVFLPMMANYLIKMSQDLKDSLMNLNGMLLPFMNKERRELLTRLSQGYLVLS